MCIRDRYAFTLALKMTSSMTLIPYLLVAAYGLKLAWSGETYQTDSRERVVDGVRGALATVFAVGMICAGGKFLLLSAVLYATGTILYVVSRREQSKAVFTGAEAVIFAAVLVAAVAGLYGLVSGAISV